MLKIEPLSKINQQVVSIQKDRNLESLTEEVQNLFVSMSSSLSTQKQINKNKDYQLHFVQSRLNIQKAAEGLKGTALVLGVGGGHDIPVKLLAEQFDKLVLIDIDHSLIDQALKDVPADLLSKIEIVKADLTGYFSELSKHAEAIAKKTPKNQFWNEILKMIMKLERKPFDFPENGASFVVSSMICSQLSSIVQVYLEHLYIRSYSQETQYPEDNQNFKDFAISIETSHISDLHKWSSSTGKVYFSTETTIEHFTKKQQGDEEVEISVMPRCLLASARPINQHIQKYFSGIEKKAWDWINPQRDFYQRHGVTAIFLQKK